ncbi:hypothetical protein B0T16DRAFT_429843 [Cercophora newfieldiana]|uniref:4-coumarate-CoA ligase n=1 Tax=Cercophora newfieldiana TaxID=92897 RepID=A0AA40CL89_9PEZI|nr:hypothetical protein B0T16DRAFT_429843 [Cercophora newfieldiana]
MTITSRWNIDIPRCSLQQWIFGSATGPLPDTPIFLDPERADNFLTKRTYRLLGKRVAIGLKNAGLQAGDRVLLFSGNNLYFPSVFIGVLMAGGIFTGANPTFVPRELAYQLKDSGASFLIVAEAALKTALEAAKEIGFPKERIYVFGGNTPPAPEVAQSPNPGPGVKGRVDGVKHWTELIADNLNEAEYWSWDEPLDATETTCCLNYSSGTTGVPKGVEISHYSYVANGAGVVFTQNLDPEWPQKKSRWMGLCFLPLYHTYGQTYFVANFAKMDVPTYVMAGFDFVKMLEFIQKYRITALAAVPPIVLALAKHPLAMKFDLSSVESVGSGAAPLGREVCEEVEKGVFKGKLTIRQGWGMTEMTCTALSWDPRRLAPSIGVGEMMPNCKARLMTLDGTTEITKANERGELWVTGPTMMRRYWRKPDATADTTHTDSDGTIWLKTGDIAYVDEYRPGAIFYIVDRLKELIKVKGNQVAPAELEAVLLDNPNVADVAVIGVTIDGGELPRAYIVRSPASKATEGDIAKWMEGKVAKYKQLKGGVVFTDVIPKNPSGKILRAQLRERAKKEVGGPKAKLS